MRGRARHGIFLNVVQREMIMKLVSLEIAIEGMTPLLVHRFTDEAAMQATSGSGTAIVGDRGTPKEQAEQVLYTSETTGKPIVPQPNIYRCILDAGKFFKAGRSKVTTQKSSLIPACMTIDQLEIPIKHEEPWTVDTRPVRIPSTGGRILRHRPCFHDWKLEFSVQLDVEVIDAKMFRNIVDAAGQKIGLGDFRPDCKGPYGRFVVVKWKQTNGSKTKTTVTKRREAAAK